MSNNIKSYEYTKIDPKQYIYLLYRYKLFIVLSISIIILIVIFTNMYFVDKTYEVKTKIQITNDSENIYNDLDQAINIMKSRSFLIEVNDNYNMNLSSDYINKLVSNDSSYLLNKRGEHIIEISIKGDDPEKIQILANNISKYFITKSKIYFDKKSKLMEQYIQYLINEKKNISKLENEIRLLIKKYKNNNSKLLDINTLLYTIQKDLIKSNLSLNDKLYEKQNKINNLTPSKIINFANVPKKPINTNIKIKIFLAALFGLFISIFIIIVKEFIQNTNWNKYKN